MGYPARLDLEILQGATFNPALRWGVEPLIFKSITAITKAAPPVLTVTGHSVPDNWPVLFTNIGGMTQLNARHDPPRDTDYAFVRVDDANHVHLERDATGYSTYTSGGVLAYLTPQSLAGYTARMQIRETQDSATVLLELTTENNRITLHDATKTIQLTVTPEDTAELSFATGVYDLEMIDGDGSVIRLASGRVKLLKEVTR